MSINSTIVTPHRWLISRKIHRTPPPPILTFTRHIYRFSQRNLIHLNCGMYYLLAHLSTSFHLYFIRHSWLVVVFLLIDSFTSLACRIILFILIGTWLVRVISWLVSYRLIYYYWSRFITHTLLVRGGKCGARDVTVSRFIVQRYIASRCNV